MDFDFTTLITDRSEADLDAIKGLLAKPLKDWTYSELQQFNAGVIRGGYTWVDLNRVTACMEFLAGKLGAMGYQSGYAPIKVDRPDVPGPGRLPSGYRELEYIEGSGTQYVDTGRSMTADTDILRVSSLHDSVEHIWAFVAFGRLRRLEAIWSSQKTRTLCIC